MSYIWNFFILLTMFNTTTSKNVFSLTKKASKMYQKENEPILLRKSHVMLRPWAKKKVWLNLVGFLKHHIKREERIFLLGKEKLFVKRKNCCEMKVILIMKYNEMTIKMRIVTKATNFPVCCYVVTLHFE